MAQQLASPSPPPRDDYALGTFSTTPFGSRATAETASRPI